MKLLGVTIGLAALSLTIGLIAVAAHRRWLATSADPSDAPDPTGDAQAVLSEHDSSLPPHLGLLYASVGTLEDGRQFVGEAVLVPTPGGASVLTVAHVVSDLGEILYTRTS